jgi:hypothetical protein
MRVWNEIKMYKKILTFFTHLYIITSILQILIDVIYWRLEATAARLKTTSPLRTFPTWSPSCV